MRSLVNGWAALDVMLALLVPSAIHSERPQPARADDAPGRTLRLAVYDDPHSLQPLLLETIVDGYLANLAFDTLLSDDRTGQLVPDLAVAVPTVANHGISADGRTIVLHLHRGVKWHDGAPFTAADVVFTMRAILDPRNAVANRAIRGHRIGSRRRSVHGDVSFEATPGELHVQRTRRLPDRTGASAREEHEPRDR
jgi:ABC-type transport system substrate-binding protein